ncbi:hypothetical protein Taro_021666 [Colocasia esculenta]|uniref:Retrotransposon gag domain-containing protein n=1 Tax=Colocasia esculenta TaxID=4460 RepID=A0A843UZN3_COLES|nr:hypothetical protein [Colocasia esculenta]
MERFKRMAPPSFKGESWPLLVESWMMEIEKIFRAIRCAEEDKVSLATYMLQERADVWWSSLLRTRFEDGAIKGRVEEFLATGEAGDPHTKPLFFPVVSAATCTDHHLEVDQRWLTGARGKTLVREAELDRAENSGSGGGFRKEASKGSARIEVWQDFLHASEGTSVDTTWASVDTLSQHSPEGVLGRSLVSTLPDLVSTLPDQFCPKDLILS